MARSFIVIGGGCYGSHHVRQLEKGRAKGRIGADDRIVVVNRNANCQVLREVAENPNSHLSFAQSDWLEYLKAELDHLPAADEIVPAPFAPHLAAQWLLWSLGQHLPPDSVETLPFSDEFGGLPYEYLSAAGERFISAAGWVCPPNCRAPKKCPAILAPRTWDLSDTIRDFTAARPDQYAGAALFTTTYRSAGIETIAVGFYRETRDRLLSIANSGAALDKSIVVATLSPCHAATSLIHFKIPAAVGAS